MQEATPSLTPWIAKLRLTSCHANPTIHTTRLQVRQWCARIIRATICQVPQLIKWIHWPILPRNLNTTRPTSQTSVVQSMPISSQHKTKWKSLAFFWKAVKAACSLSNRCTFIKTTICVLVPNLWHQTFRSHQWVLMASKQTKCKINRCTVLSVDTSHRAGQSTWPLPTGTSTFSKTINRRLLSRSLVWELHSNRWTSNNLLCSQTIWPTLRIPTNSSHLTKPFTNLRFRWGCEPTVETTSARCSVLRSPSMLKARIHPSRRLQWTWLMTRTPSSCTSFPALSKTSIFWRMNSSCL